MFKLDNNFLNSMGLGSLPIDEKNKLLQAIYERLEMNVGMRLAENMTDEQLNEFEGFIDRSDEAGALSWLESNFPNYKQVVANELDKLKAEISASAPQIIAAALADPGLEQPAAQPHPQPHPGMDATGPPQQQPPLAQAQPPMPAPDSHIGQQQESVTPEQFVPQQPPAAPQAPWDQQ